MNDGRAPANRSDALLLFDADYLPTYLQVHDPEVLNDFYNLFVSQAKELDSGLRDLNVLDQGEELARLCHKHKSSANAIGAFRLGELLQELESSIKSGNAELASLSELAVKARETTALTISAVNDQINSN